MSQIDELSKRAISQPLVNHIYTADPSAHVFNGRIYIYPSHDVEAGVPEDDLGNHFDMRDYHVFSMDTIGSEVIDHGVALDVKDIPWASRQMWAPDATFANDTYYFFFPAKDKDGIFRIGVATSKKPEGPFVAEREPVKGSFSIDPAVFKDDDGSYYLYFGGIWGGQLQRWKTGTFKAEGEGPFAQLPEAAEPALCAKVAKLSHDLLEFVEVPKDVIIVDENSKPLLQGDNGRRFFEASWMHKYKGKYYFSYSTGDTHYICYAVGDSPYGPFTYKGILLHPVEGWTNHHSTVEVNGKWYLFYHDVQLSGKTHLRNIKVAELHHNDDGTIQAINPYQ